MAATLAPASLALAALLLQVPPAATVDPPDIAIEKVFHIAGIPRLARDARGDLRLAGGQLEFTYRKDSRLVVPVQRIRRVDVLAGERHHAKAAAAAAAAAGLVGALLILKKQDVDTLIIDYESERGGRMGIVFQVPNGQGRACGEWLARSGVEVTHR